MRQDGLAARPGCCHRRQAQVLSHTLFRSRDCPAARDCQPETPGPAALQLAATGFAASSAEHIADGSAPTAAAAAGCGRREAAIASGIASGIAAVSEVSRRSACAGCGRPPAATAPIRLLKKTARTRAPQPRAESPPGRPPRMRPRAHCVSGLSICRALFPSVRSCLRAKAPSLLPQNVEGEASTFLTAHS
jgi:hypothetical protein